MILELHLKNFILIKEVRLSFSSGFTILTGETGAGKTLLVQALKFVLGARASSKYIRTGAEQAMVQAIFDIPSDIMEKLIELGIPCDEDLVLRRTFGRDGKSRNYVNGAIVSLQNIRDIASNLISIAGQHQYQELLKPEKHRIALDAFAGLLDKANEVKSLHKKLKVMERKLESLLRNIKKDEEEIRLLEREAREIDFVSPKSGEDEVLEQEKKVLKAASNLMASGDICYSNLYGKKESIIELISLCRQELDRMHAIDPMFEKELSELENISYTIQEIANTVRDYKARIPTDISRLDEIEERIYRLRELMRRYGPSIDDVNSYRRDLDERIMKGKVGEKGIRQLEKKIKASSKELLEMSTELSKKRHDASLLLSDEVSRELSDLKLLKAGFKVEVKTAQDIDVSNIGPYGIDQVQFLFRPNLGEPFLPIDSIASGGELSRVMLALRAVLSRKSQIDTVVFDEIDAGISGEVAEKVGTKLKTLSESGQVIAITHFPQIAALAHQHMTVKKEVTEGKTITIINKIRDEDRKSELARMLGGERDAALTYAKNLLERTKSHPDSS